MWYDIFSTPVLEASRWSDLGNESSFFAISVGLIEAHFSAFPCNYMERLKYNSKTSELNCSTENSYSFRKQKSDRWCNVRIYSEAIQVHHKVLSYLAQWLWFQYMSTLERWEQRISIHVNNSNKSGWATFKQWTLWSVKQCSQNWLFNDPDQTRKDKTGLKKK